MKSVSIALAMAALTFCLAVGGAAKAGSFQLQTTPAGAAALFAPADVLTFDSVAPGIYTSLTQGLLTFTADGGAGSFFVDGSYIGQYNNFGVNSVHNCYCDTSFGELDFAFSSPVAGFGFFWGASDDQWTLTAYDASNNVVATALPNITGPSNAGDFIGLTGAGMVRATLTGPSSDYIFVDDVTFGTVLSDTGITDSGGGGIPEPVTWAMMILGFAGVGATLRSRRAAAVPALV
jgi:hypothetical protein